MSYCVNCGVELDATHAGCPLCNTPVYNPNQPIDRSSPTPYPVEPGKAEEVVNKEFTVLMTIVFATISVVCGMLNLLVLDMTRWSLYIIGALAVAWVFMIPVFLRDKLPAPICLALNGVAVALYVGMISLLHPGHGWYIGIALPIICVATMLMEVFYLFTIRMKTSLLSRAVVMMLIIAAVTVTVEVLIGLHFHGRIILTWSAVVLLCCVAVDVILITISLHKGLRSELRKRMHF